MRYKKIARFILLAGGSQPRDSCNNLQALVFVNNKEETGLDFFSGS